jgi:hypothetical protein
LTKPVALEESAHAQKRPDKDDAARPPGEIVQQLAQLLQIKKAAIESAVGDFADEMTLTTIERQEKALYAELRSALRPASRRPRAKRAG